MTYICSELKGTEANPFKDMHDFIKEQVLNYATVTDLTYHAKLLTYLIENPQLIRPSQLERLNQSSALEERKEAEKTDQPKHSFVEPHSLD